MSVGEKPLVEFCCLKEIIRDRDSASFGFALEGWGHKDMRDGFRLVQPFFWSIFCTFQPFFPPQGSLHHGILFDGQHLQNKLCRHLSGLPDASPITVHRYRSGTTVEVDQNSLKDHDLPIFG